MAFSPERLAAELERGGRYLVAYSGGADSTALLHAAAALAAEGHIGVRAAHVDHALNPRSAAWADHCRGVCERFGLAFAVERLSPPPTGPSVEAAARRARYGVLASMLEPGETLLTAHHADDQLETVLLRLLRGAGPRGLAGIARRRPLGDAVVFRPLLDVTRAELVAYCRSAGEDWLEDPANRLPEFDRSFLRTEIVPRLEARWPGLRATVARAARLFGEADGLTRTLAGIDLGPALESGPMPLAPLLALPSPRIASALRHALIHRGLPVPELARLDTLIEQLRHARPDAMPAVTWPGVEARRYRDRLFLDPPLPPRTDGGLRIAAEETLTLGDGLLTLAPGDVGGLAPDIVDDGLEVRFRRGGERLRLPGRRHRTRLDRLFQERGVVPWMRDRLPLLYAGETLVAVADLALAAEAAVPPGERSWRVVWRPHRRDRLD